MEIRYFSSRLFCACIPITLEIKMECWQHKRLSQGKKAGERGEREENRVRKGEGKGEKEKWKKDKKISCFSTLKS